MEEKLDIFVFTHKTPKFIPKNKCYKMVCLEEDETKVNTELEKIVCYRENDNLLDLEHAYSEGARIHYIWKNIPLKKYVGTAHYRRFFEFMNNIPNMDDIFKTHDAILPDFNLGWSSLENQYANSHNIEDLKTIIDIIKEFYPEYYATAIKTIEGADFYPCNIFIMEKEMFEKYCEFVFGVLDRFNEKMNFKTDLDTFNWVVNHLNEYCEKKQGMLESANYQARIQAFLMERISNIFFNKNIKNPYLCELRLTELNFDIETDFFKLYEE